MQFLKDSTIAVGIEAGIWGGWIGLQNLQLSLVVQVSVSQCSSRPSFPVVRVPIALPVTVGPAQACIITKHLRQLKDK